jgi:hypothetical protein
MAQGPLHALQLQCSNLVAAGGLDPVEPGAGGVHGKSLSFA